MKQKYKLAIVGSQIGYTLSPKIHAAILAAQGLDCEFHVHDVTIDELRDIVPYMVDNGYDGFFVTKPYKQEIARYMNKLNTTVGVNVVKIENDYLTGYSTDGDGFMLGLSSAYGGELKSALVLGAGGAAHAIVHTLKNHIPEIHVANRDISRAKELCAKEGVKLFERGGAELIVNAITPIEGVNPLDLFPTVDISNIKCVYDIVYSPPITELMRAFEGKAAVIGGLDMLIYQAILGDSIIIGKQIEVTTSLVKAVKEAL